jgi:hypothetical protein
MPKIAVVAASLWDLRALCEQQLRAITDAQRLIDHYRDNPAVQGNAKRLLLEDLAVLIDAHGTIGDSLADCKRAMIRLPNTVGDGAEAAPGA